GDLRASRRRRDPDRGPRTASGESDPFPAGGRGGGGREEELAGSHRDPSESGSSARCAGVDDHAQAGTLKILAKAQRGKARKATSAHRPGSRFGISAIWWSSPPELFA